MKPAQIKASTQKFTEIQEIRDNVVLLEGGQACLILQITATNFSLLSREEQDASMFAYATFLNSLSFPVEILIRNKKVQIESYLKLLDQEAKKTSNQKLATEINLYREFVENLIKTTTILDKQFYVVLPYSSLEAGIKGAATAAPGKSAPYTEDFFMQARVALKGKADSLLGQIERVGLRAKVLEREELIRLFYDIYNPDSGGLQQDIDDATKPMLVSTNKIV